MEGDKQRNKRWRKAILTMFSSSHQAKISSPKSVMSGAGCPHFRRVWSQMRRIIRPNWSQTRILMTFVKEKQISEGRILFKKKLRKKTFAKKC